MEQQILERFDRKYLKLENGCWEWQAATRHGYGVIRTGKSMSYTHRLSYQHSVGPIPENLEIDHLCRNRLCVNPSHLEAVPHVVNCRRGLVGTKNRSKTHCKHGHEFTTENTRIRTSRGSIERECLTCSRGRLR